MVFTIDSDYAASAASTPAQPPLTATSSLASDEDLEGGYSSQEDIDSSGREHDVAMVSKFIPSGKGKVHRRRSQCEQLSFRQRSHGSSAIPSAPATQPATFGRWNSPVMTSANSDLPKNIQFYPPSNSSPMCSSIKQQRSPLLVVGSIALLALTGTVFVQQSQISALSQEAEIKNQHRAYLERSQSNLFSQLNARDTSLEQYKHSNQKMIKVSHDMSASMLKLREDYMESSAEVARLREVEKRVKWSEGRWEKYVGGIGEQSKRSVIEKYGAGPQQVHLKVQLPATSPLGPELATIKIDLAPLDMMPHSVHTFLEQVDMGAWDGTSFNIHAGHVLMAHSSGSTDKDAPQQTVVPPKVTFPEFNAEYPHNKYTVAFPPPTSSSSNNGVDFYINLQHNIHNHSPRIDNEGSDNNIEQYVEGESCFGQISEEASRIVVDKMDALRVEGTRGMLTEPVVIKSARIIRR